MANNPEMAVISQRFCGASPELVSELTAELQVKLAGLSGWAALTTYHEHDAGRYAFMFEGEPEQALPEIQKIESCLLAHFRERGVTYQKARAHHATAQILRQHYHFDERELSKDKAKAQGFGFQIPGAS